MWFIEDTVNEMTPCTSNGVFAPKYSILRMMCRIWGEYVMKKLLPAFIDKIKDVLLQYNKQIHKLGYNYESIIGTKYGATSLKQK